MKWLQTRAEALLVGMVLWLLRRLSPIAASDLGGAMARGIGPKLPVSRTAEANLRRAMPELDAASRAAVIRAVWDNIGRTAAEFPHLAKLDIEVVGAEHLRDLPPGPAIFISGHIGNWETLPMTAARLGFRASSFYRAAKNPEVDRMVSEMRLAAVGPGTPNYAKGAAGARAAMAHLGRGLPMGILIDQKMNDGIEVPFFGLPAMTAPAAAAFALRFKAHVIPLVARRLGPARIRVVLEKRLDLPDSGDRKADILALTTTFNQILERWISDRPGEWLWLHRRWPREGAR